MKNIVWDEAKNGWLKEHRGISFEDVATRIVQGDVLDVITHPNQKRYFNQRQFILYLHDYVYAVPFVEDDNNLFLKTIIPSRKAKKKYLSKG